MRDKDRNNQYGDTTTHQDGKDEGILNDSTGIQFGIMLEENVTNPTDIVYMNKSKSKPKEK